VVFWSFASNLVPGDTNSTPDVFLHDMLNGVTTRVSVDSSGLQGNGLSYQPSISADGRYVAFESGASNLVSGDTNGWSDIFVKDTVSGTTTRVSVDSNGVQGNQSSDLPSISADGRHVAFQSYATNLVAGDTNGPGIYDVFVHDMVDSSTVRVSVDSNGLEGNGVSGGPSISGDGRYVAFWSQATNLVPGDTNGFRDIFVHDIVTGITTRVSVDSNGIEGDDFSQTVPRISFDGRFVAFSALADNLVPGDTNGMVDVFVHDRLSGATTRVSVDSSGVQGDADSGFPAILSISGDGRFVAFSSNATNLVPGDTNGLSDVFLRDRGDASAFTPLCFGDGTGGTCPCSNAGTVGHGCENSATTGGALLSSSGIASLSSDTVQLASSSELTTALSIVLQGNSVIAPVNFGDGLRCAGGALKRLYVKHAIGGMISAPQAGDPPISARSAALGDSIPLGATRAYQVYYRDPNLGFCPAGFNASNAVAIAWGA
jgi:Tol biopolymer transport system component